MFKHVLVPTDGSALSEKAIENAMQFARSISAKVTCVTVCEPFHVISANPMMVADTEEEYHRHCEERAEQFLRVARHAAEAAGVAYAGVHLYSSHPYQGIIQTAEERGCDVICMASHGRKGLQSILIGSETSKVLTHTKIPVLVWR